MNVPNKTHYYCRYSRPVNIFVDPDSFGSDCSRRQAFFQRLYYEHEYTKMVNGISFFLTCTYNNAAIPMYQLGDTSFPCFNYEHIRLLTNGALSKILARQYGSRLRYFCACESGEGKGKRGLGNNPHYHFIFNIQPLHIYGKPDYSNYKLITEREFVKLVKDTWQGSEWKFQLMRFGMVKPGKYGATIVGAGDAFSYVGKYVTKSVQDHSNELKIENYYYHLVRKKGITHSVLLAYYYYLRQQSCDSYSRSDFFDDARFREYQYWRRSYNPYERKDYYQKFLLSWYQGVPFAQDLLLWFDKYYVLDYVRDKVSEYRNKYSGKVRISKSYGEYGLHFITDIDTSPKLRVIHSGTAKTQTPCLFYLRKLYYDVKICPYTGNPLYVLSRFGREVKCNQLSSKVQNMVQRIKQSIAYVVHNRLFIPYGSDTVDRWQSVGLDPSVSDNKSLLPFIRVMQLERCGDLFESSACYQYLKKYFFGWSEFDTCLLRYSYYKIVYENRVWTDNGLSCYLSANCDFKDVLADYNDYLSYNYNKLEFQDNICYSLIFFSSQDSAHAFSAHPAFSPYFTHFLFLDKFLYEVSALRSAAKKADFCEKSDLIKLHNQVKYNELDLLEF